MRFSLGIVFGLVGSVSAVAGDMREDGMEAFARGRYAAAYDLLYPVARSGDPEAKYLVGRMLDEGLAGSDNADKGLAMLIDAARLGHVDARRLLDEVKHCVAESSCDGTEAVEIWTCGGQRLRVPSASGVGCAQLGRGSQPVDEIIRRSERVDRTVYRNFGELPGGQAAGQFNSAEECAAWAAAAGPNETRRCSHQ